MREKGKWILVAVTGLLLVTAAAVTAATVYEISFTNNLRTDSVDIQLLQYKMTPDGEELLEPGLAAAGQPVSYIPRIQNLRRDSYVRVSFRVTGDGRDYGTLTEEEVLGLGENWIMKGEYFYCTEILGRDEIVEVFRGLKDPGKWLGIEKASFKIVAKADAIQSDNLEPDFGAASPWGLVDISPAKEEGDVVYGRAGQVSREKIAVFSPGQGFESSASDLFDEFGRYEAGDAFEDTVQLENRAAEPVIMYFRAEPAGGMLPEGMKLEIRCGGSVIYDGPLAGHGLEEYMALGRVDRGQTLEVEFRVTLPAEADNRYSILEDCVIWKFKAETDEGGGLVQTGDGRNMPALVALAAVALAALIVIRRGRKNGSN